MYCTKCGHESSEDDVFCRKCGFPLKPTTSATVMQKPETNSNAQGTTRIKQKNGFATASLVCGILGCLFAPLSILAIIFGAIGMGRKDKSKRGIAIAGFVLGVVGVIAWVIFYAWFFQYKQIHGYYPGGAS